METAFLCFNLVALIKQHCFLNEIPNPTNDVSLRAKALPVMAFLQPNPY